MRLNEAMKIGEIIQSQDSSAISPCLNLGSSTGDFRVKEQPHIDRYIFTLLRDRNVRIIHADIKASKGVDLVGDIFDPAMMDAIRKIAPACVLCCNMLEHVNYRQELAAIITEMLGCGGLLIVTVPHSYPVHYDPIDTYFRPTPKEIHELFPNFELVEGGIISDSTYYQDLIRSKGVGGTLLQFAKSVIKLFMFWRGSRHWIGHFHRYLWLFRPYRVSYVLMRKR